MSELKEHQFCESDEFFREYPGPLSNELRLYYLKSDADAVIAELKEDRRWRKFPDEKPKWGEEVLVVDDERKQYIVRFSHDMKWISWGKMNTCESNCVKYWMPLPEAPKEEK